MGDIKDKNGNIIVVGNRIDVGGLITRIDEFVVVEDDIGQQLMARTAYGDFSVSSVEKV